jgi:hypothetical protein
LYALGELGRHAEKLNDPKRRYVMKSFKTTHLTWGFLFALLLSSPAFAQYGGGTGGGSSTPSYGSGKAVAAGVGAAAVGAGVLYLTLHHRGSLTGCVQGSDDTWSLVDDKKHQTYTLLPGSGDLKSGQRLKLKGKKSKDANGAQTFRVSKVAKDLGDCNMQSVVASSSDPREVFRKAEK